MKNLIIIFLFGIILTSCTKEITVPGADKILHDTITVTKPGPGIVKYDTVIVTKPGKTDTVYKPISKTSLFNLWIVAEYDHIKISDGSTIDQSFNLSYQLYDATTLKQDDNKDGVFELSYPVTYASDMSYVIINYGAGAVDTYYIEADGLGLKLTYNDTVSGIRHVWHLKKK